MDLSIFISRLSAKATNAPWNVLVTFTFYFCSLLIWWFHKTDTLQNTWRWVAGLYSGNLAYLYVVGHPLRHQWVAHNCSPETYLFRSRLDLAGWPVTVRFIIMLSGGSYLSFKIFKFNCCGLDVHKTWIYACIGITDSNNRTEYKQARFSSFSKGLHQLCVWLAKYNCNDVCMESTGKYWIPVFNILEQHKIRVTLSHPKYTKPMKGNKTDRKDAKWITCAAWWNLLLFHLLTSENSGIS